LEKLPSHRDFATVWTADQRHNLGLNGQVMLDNLSSLKVTLVDRVDRWSKEHPGDLYERVQNRLDRGWVHGIK